MELSDSNYIVIQAWMITRLGLSGTELMCYAAIYGFSQAGSGVYRGGVEYLMEWTGASKPTIIKTLHALTRRGLIIKEKIGRVCVYTATPVDSTTDWQQPADNAQPEPEEAESTAAEKVKNFNLFNGKGKSKDANRLNYDTRKGKETLPKNIKENKEIYTPPLTPPHGPTLAEVTDFARRRQSRIDPREFYEHYDALHWQLYGKPIEDWQALFCKWETDTDRDYSGKKRKPWALDYIHDNIKYTRDELRKLGISFGEEFYEDD